MSEKRSQQINISALLLFQLIDFYLAVKHSEEEVTEWFDGWRKAEETLVVKQGHFSFFTFFIL